MSDPIPVLPVEMKLEILSRLSIKDLLQFRLVNSYCKDLISALFREFTCVISDDNYASMLKSTEEFRTIRVTRLTDSMKKVVSSTRGPGRLMVCAERLQISGTEIEGAILRKLLRYATHVSELEFHNSVHRIVNTTLSRGKDVYRNVTKLTLVQGSGRNLDVLDLDKSYPKEIGIHANLSLPQLQHLSIHWTDPRRSEQWYYNGHNTQVFYFYLFQLIASLGGNLKSLELKRDQYTTDLSGRDFGSLQYYPVVRKVPQLEQKILEGLRKCKFEKLKISTSCSRRNVLNRGIFDRTDNLKRFERLLFESADLQEVYVENIFHQRNYADEPIPNFPAVGNDLYRENRPETLRRLVIHCSFPKHEYFSVAIFGRCSQLKEFTLILYYENTPNNLLPDPSRHFRNRVMELEKLPPSLELLQFVPPHHDDQHRSDFQQRFPRNVADDADILLSRDQIEWIIAGNLPKLKHLGCLLIVEQPGLEKQRQAVNMDLELFKELVNMNQLDSLDLNMLSVNSLRDRTGWLLMRNQTLHPLTSAVRDSQGLESYLEFCRNNGKIRRVETKVRVNKYVLVTINKL